MAKPLLHVDFEQPDDLVFNRSRMRQAFVKIGQLHMRDARRLVIKRGRSSAGDNPSFQTGKLARSIGYYVPRASSRRPGLMVKIAPNQKNGKGNRRFGENDAFYPAFLFYGVRTAAYGMSKKDRRAKKHHKTGGWRVAPRNNYMTDVLEARRGWTKYILLRALRTSLRPERKKK